MKYVYCIGMKKKLEEKNEKQSEEGSVYYIYVCTSDILHVN